MAYRPTAALAFATLAVFAATPLGCSRRAESTAHPESTAVDPMEELRQMPAAIETELNLVLAPIHGVDQVVEQLTTMPDRLGIDAASLRALAAASLREGSVVVELDASAEVRAEVEQLLLTIRGIGEGFRATPQRLAAAAKRIAARGAKATVLVTKLTTRHQIKLMSPFTPAEEKARVTGELEAIAKIEAEIKLAVTTAQSTVLGLPARTTAAAAKIAAAFTVG